LLAEKTTTTNTNAHLKAQVSALQNESDTLRTMMDAARRNILDSDAGHRSMSEQLDTQSSTIARVQKEHALLSKDFEDKLNDIKVLRGQKTALEKKTEEYRQGCEEKNKLEVLLAEKKEVNQAMAEEIVVIKNMNKN